ncbi:MAG TPA: nucleotide exchange factor GrpE [Myxococcota bacterium]
MSGESEKQTKPAEDSAGTEGWESLAEDACEGTLAPNPELEEALREAAASVPDADDEERDSAQAGISEDELQSLRDELAEAEGRNLRLQADYENFRKRALRERQEAAQYGSQNLVKDLLSVVDNLERAIGHARQSEGGDLQSLLQGVELVQREFIAVLAKHHVVEIDAHGKPFNPALHEAMAQFESGTAQPNTVVDVLEKGYQLHDRLIRPSRVIVAREPEEKTESGEADDGEIAD